MKSRRDNMWTQLPPGPIVAPSLLSVDFARAGEQIDRVLGAGVKMLHVDIMDGHFVPNLSMGPPVVEKLRRYTDAALDVHLMVTDPGLFIELFAEVGADSLNFHIEACGEPGREATDRAIELIERIRELGLGVGLTLKPATPADTLPDIVELVDMVLVMTVEPGFGGQKFMANMLPKIETLRGMLSDRQRLQVDGGINPETARQCRSAGADVFVAGNNIFGDGDPADSVRNLRDAITVAG